MKDTINTENLKLLFGIKIKSYRTRQGLSLQDVAKKSGIAISYLSEIESGKKYPKPEKLIQLAQALGVDYDKLVSIQSDKSLDPFAALINSDLVRQFPFYLFGITSADIVGLFKNSAEHASAFLQTFLQISRVYDLSLENFLFAALRAYIRQHKNYFPELEKKAADLVRKNNPGKKKSLSYEKLKAILKEQHGYQIDEEILNRYPDLKGFRSVLQGERRLAVNDRLLTHQKAFVLARELGFIELGIKERPITSSWIKVHNFKELVNNFKASYFGGALLLDQQALVKDLRAMFKQKIWENTIFTQLLDMYQVTPEMLLYRISQILPVKLGIDQIFYFRFTHTQDLYSVMLTKELNMTRTLLTYGLGLNEHYCRRMLPLQFLADIHQKPQSILAGVQIIEFVDSQDRFLLLSMARPLSLSQKRGSAIAVGIKVDSTSKSLIQFIHDPKIPVFQVSETCERCPLTDCSVRVVAAENIIRQNRIEKWETALKKIQYTNE